MRKTYSHPQSKTIDFALEQHILLSSNNDTIIDNDTENEVGANESLSKKRNPIWNASEK